LPDFADPMGSRQGKENNVTLNYLTNAPRLLFATLLAFGCSQSGVCQQQSYTVSSLGTQGKDFHTGHSVAVDAQGNLFIADSGRSAVLKVSPEGSFSTVAGKVAGGIISIMGSGAFSGDGGPATQAGLNAPGGLAVDGEGNLFIADTQNHRVRKVDGNGRISTIAGRGTGGFSGDGGAAVSAQLAFPSGVAVDSAGNVYIADTFNNRVRKVTRKGIISTVVGQPVSAPVRPRQLALDSKGNLYITDDNAKVVRLSPQGAVSVFAGTGSDGSSGDGGPAVQARLNRPFGVALDAADNVFVAEFGGRRIRMITSDGVIRTIAGNGMMGFSGDGGPALDARFGSPTAIAVAANGTIYVADTAYFGPRIRVLTPLRSPPSISGSEGPKPTGTIVGIAERQIPPVSAEQIRLGALKALADNSPKFRDIVYSNEESGEFSGTTLCMLQPCPRVSVKTPQLLSHYEVLQGKKTLVYDGWNDDPTPLSQRYPKPEQRAMKLDARHGNYDTESLVTEILRGGHRFTFLGVKQRGDERFYTLQASSIPPSPFTPLGTARCAAAMTATLLVDPGTMFPVYFEAEVVHPKFCGVQDGSKDTYALDIVGTKVNAEFTLAKSQEHCSDEPREIYVLKRSETRSSYKGSAFQIAPRDSIVNRTFPAGEGEIRTIASRSNFKVFAVGCKISYDLDTIPPEQPAIATTRIMNDGKPLTTDPPACADFCGVLQGTFDLGKPPNIVIDGRSFEGRLIGVNGDYRLPDALKRVVLATGQEIGQTVPDAKFGGVFRDDTIMGELLRQRMTDVFGDQEVTAGRVAAVALIVGTRAEEASKRVFSFHREFTWDFARRLGDGQQELARNVYRANFLIDAASPARSADKSGGLPLDRRVAGTSAETPLLKALRDGCVGADLAATRYLTFLLAGSGLDVAQAHIENAQTPGAIRLIIASNKAEVLSVWSALRKKQEYFVMFTERDANDRAIGVGLFGIEDKLTSYVKTQFRGELCGRQ
jgi:hypothetical protein